MTFTTKAMPAGTSGTTAAARPASAWSPASSRHTGPRAVVCLGSWRR